MPFRVHSRTITSSEIFAVIVLCATLRAPLAASDRPNILFVFSDDHATQAIGAYGSKINKTPNIDRIANEGAVFKNSFCTNSICGPSRASILTGKHSHLNGFLRNGNRFDPTQLTFPKLMQQAGYETAIIGKWHLSSQPVGFDYWEVLPGQGHYYNPDFIQMDGSRKRYTGYCTDLITDLSLKWLKEQRDPKKPFILMSQHKAPHRNWAPHPRHFSLYKNEDVPEPPTLFDNYEGRTKLLKQNEMSVKDHFFWAHDMKFHGEVLFPKHFVAKYPNHEYSRMTPEQQTTWDAQYEPENKAFIARMTAGELSDEEIVRWKYQRYIKDYLRCIQAVDDGVGRLLDYLDETGLSDKTIVIYCSDQGFYLGEHGWYDKRWMFEESLQMPFLIRWPGVVQAGTRSSTLIQNIDYAPTFLDVAGADIPAEIQGNSLVSALKDTTTTPSGWRDAIYYAYYENASVHNVPVHDGIRTNRYKLMFFPRTLEWQLFDVERDPLEMQSVHTNPEYGQLLARLQKRYDDLRDFYGVNSAIIPATRGDEPRWKARDEAMTARAKQGDVDLAFIGDSITEGWEGAGKKVWQQFYGKRKTLNLGISGDRTEHIIWRLTHGNLENVTPKVAVVMIGTNNTGHFMQDPIEVAAGVERIVEILGERVPSTQILLLGVFPRGANPTDEGRLNNIAINQVIRRLHDGVKIHYADIGAAFLENDKTITPEIMPDALHLSAEGYQRWAEALEPHLKLLGL